MIKPEIERIARQRTNDLLRLLTSKNVGDGDIETFVYALVDEVFRAAAALQAREGKGD